MPVNDADLLQKLQAGDVAAQQQLFQRCQVRLRPYFRSRLPNSSDIDDCISEVTTRALEGICKGQQPQVLDAWLTGIAWNLLKDRYAEAKQRDHSEISVDLPGGPADLPLVLEETEPSSEDLPEAPTDLEFLLGKRELWSVVRAAIDGINPTLQPIMRAHIELTMERHHPVVGAELAAALGMSRNRVDRQLNRARQATRTAMVALVLARTGRRHCAELARLLNEILTIEQQRAGRNLVLDPGQSQVVGEHATGCEYCGSRANEVNGFSRWALGPMLAAPANDNGERRSEASAFSSRTGTDSVPPLPSATTSLRVSSSSPVTDPVSNGATTLAELIAPLRVALTSRMAQLPGIDTVVRFAQQDPDTFRRIVAAVVGGIGLIAALIITVPAISRGHAPAQASPSSRSAGPTTSGAPNASHPAGGVAAPGGTGPGVSTPSGSAVPGGGKPSSSVPGSSAVPGGTGSSAVPGGTEPSVGTPSGSVLPGGATTGPSSSISHSGSTTAPATVPMTWGFAHDLYVTEPVGRSHDLSAANPESNWTYGPWRLASPAPAGKPTATHLAVGMHRIRLPGVGAPGGVVHVTTFDANATGAFCQPSAWGVNGADETIDVACFDHAGTAADVPFLVLFIAASPDNPISAGGRRGYVFNDRPTATFTPDRLHGLNAGTVNRSSTGRYTVDLPNSAGGVIQISAVGAAPRHCAVAARSGDLINIVCVAHGTGATVDTPFTLSYAVNQNLLDDRREPVGDYVLSTDSPSAAAPSVVGLWASGNGTATLNRSAIGKYNVHFSNGYLPSTTHVTPVGTIGYCNLTVWNDYSRPNDSNAVVGCFTPSGTRINSGFYLLYASARMS